MASYVERIIDFLERQGNNSDIPKMLVEDIQWAIEVISQNRLYTGSMDSIKFNTERPEIKAWTDLINLNSIPTNKEEMERLKYYEELHKLESQKKGRKVLEKMKNSPPPNDQNQK
jgi:hypothetical protein